jgi:ABC-type protease/lipase transport system fused ATPase/permease subunit
MAFIVNVLALVQPVFMLHVYDYVLPSQSGSTLFFLTLIALFLVAVSAVIDALKSRFLQELAWQVDLQLRERSFLGAYRRGLVSRRFGQNQFAADLETIKGFVAGPGLSALLDLPWTPVFLIALLLLSPWLAGLALVFAIMVLILASSASAPPANCRRKPRCANGAAGVWPRTSSSRSMRSRPWASHVTCCPAGVRTLRRPRPSCGRRAPGGA